MVDVMREYLFLNLRGGAMLTGKSIKVSDAQLREFKESNGLMNSSDSEALKKLYLTRTSTLMF